MNEVSPKQGMLLAPGWMRQDASQIVPPRSSDPMTEEPLCQIRREARARGAVEALVSENLNAVDFNRPNREALLFKPLCLLCSTEGITSLFAAL